MGLPYSTGAPIFNMKTRITAIKRFGSVRRGETFEVDAHKANELIRIGLAVPYEATQVGKMAVAPLNKMMPAPENKQEYTVRMTSEPPISEAPVKRDGASVLLVPERKGWKRRG
jgi:hypothetical protein